VLSLWQPICSAARKRSNKKGKRERYSGLKKRKKKKYYFFRDMILLSPRGAQPMKTQYEVQIGRSSEQPLPSV
jgi:hypothetical protein